jgi:hypothetical protein
VGDRTQTLPGLTSEDGLRDFRHVRRKICPHKFNASATSEAPSTPRLNAAMHFGSDASPATVDQGYQPMG